MFFILVVVVCILIVAAQLLLKSAVGPDVAGFSSLLRSMISPLFIAGAALYLIATVIWLHLVNKYPFYLVYGFLSLSFIFALLASRYILHEQISMLSWIGMGLIALGVVTVSIGMKG